MDAARRQGGQASVELVAAIPLVVLVLVCGWQLVVAGHSWWKLQEVARLAARAHYVAEQRGERAAGLRRGRQLLSQLMTASPAASRRLRVDAAGVVTVSARVPLVTPFGELLGSGRGPRITATSRMRP